MTQGFIQFLLTALVIELTPGPNMSWLALVSARRGRLAGALATSGVALGLSLLAIFASLGIASLYQDAPVFRAFLRWAGAAFLLWLAAEAWFGLDQVEVEESGGAAGFWRGLIVNLLNPKAAAVFIVVIPNAAGSPPQPPLPVYAMAYVVIATMVHLAIILFAGSFHRMLAAPSRERLTRKAFGLAMLVITIWFALSTGGAQQTG